MEAIARLKPVDEVAVMTYHNNAELLQTFTRDRWPIKFALNHIPPHDEMANHCINKAFTKRLPIWSRLEILRGDA